MPSYLFSVYILFTRAEENLPKSIYKCVCQNLTISIEKQLKKLQRTMTFIQSKNHCFYGTQKFITMFTKPATRL